MRTTLPTSSCFWLREAPEWLPRSTRRSTRIFTRTRIRTWTGKYTSTSISTTSVSSEATASTLYMNMSPRMQTHSQQSVLTAATQSNEQRKLHGRDPCGDMGSFLILLDLFKTQTMKNVKKRRFLAHLEVDPVKSMREKPQTCFTQAFLYEIFSVDLFFFSFEAAMNSAALRQLNLYFRWTQQPQHNSSVTDTTCI